MSPNGSAPSSTEDDPYALPRRRMVERQLRRRGIEDQRVLAAMELVPRERFVPESQRRRAYRDGALPIGEGQTISQPWIVARMTAALELAGGERVLEVGTGSGYAAAVLSRCCSHVVTVERRPGLSERAAAVLVDLGYRNVELRTGDGSLGVSDRSPFDGILVTAAAEHGPPPALAEQLAPGAPLVCPVDRGRGERLIRMRDGHTEDIAPVSFVALVEGGG